MPLVQEEFWTMKLFRDRELLESGMYDSPLIYLNLSSARRSGIRPDFALQLNARFYPCGLELFENLVVDLPLSQGTLDDPWAIAQ